MADKFDKATRSRIMSKIKGKDTKPELIVRKFLHSRGYRYRLHRKDLPGRPDIVLPKYSTVIMVHGCFWHGHSECGIYKEPKTRTEFWKNKISKTQERDLRNTSLLKSQGWKVLTIYECELKKAVRERTLEELLTTL